MKKLLMGVMAVALVVAFAAVATAEKSVVSIVQCTNKADLKLLAGQVPQSGICLRA